MDLSYQVEYCESDGEERGHTHDVDWCDRRNFHGATLTTVIGLPHLRQAMLNVPSGLW